MNAKKKEQIDLKYNLKTYWSFLRNYKLLLLALLMLVLLNESLNIGTNFLYKAVIDNSTKFIEGSLLREAFIAILVSVVFIYIGIALAKAIGKWFNVHLINKLDGGIIWDLKRRFFNHIVHLSHHFHTTHKTGSLISRMSRGGGAAERMTDSIVFNFAPAIFHHM